jgi:carbamoyl-phosphate synthase small subunit
MKLTQKRDAYLLLQDGTFFKGESFGKVGTMGGEICFNTGMTGYQEIYTDPSYYGQIILNTTSHIGNYGVKSNEQESDSVKISGIVCGSFSGIHSRYSADSSLQDYLERNNIVGISHVDTRSLVRHIRSKGAMNAIISSEVSGLDQLKERLNEIPPMNGLELSSEISTKRVYEVGDTEAEIRVAVLDLGIKQTILKNFEKRGIYSRVYPSKTSFEDMMKMNPTSFFISNGPGDPAAMPYAVETVKQILNADKPVFGICLGHQLLGLANGISTYKMHNGHRGLNHPVKNLVTGLSEITSQNHGFAVKKEDVLKSDAVEMTHINLNDDTIEGMRMKRKKAFSVQYHPEASPGPHDSHYLFDDFLRMIKA